MSLVKRHKERVEKIRSGLLSIEYPDMSKFENLISGKIKIALLSELSHGKSTFLNALVFKDNILENRLGETTANIFVIEYKRNADISKQREYVKKVNDFANENIDKLEDIETKLYANNKVYKDFIFYDTPGFNSNNEDKQMQNMIDISVNQSDMVILILDISKGVTKAELEQLKKLKNQTLIVILNKIDTIDESEDVISLEKSIRKEINKIIKRDFSMFNLSSKSALAGYVTDNKLKIEKSKFEIFEKDFLDLLLQLREQPKDEIVNSYEILIDEYKKAKRIYSQTVYDFNSKILREIDKTKYTKKELHFNDLKLEIDSFPYYFEYPSKWNGGFDVDSFRAAMTKLEDGIEKFLKPLNELSDDMNKLDDKSDQMNEELEIIEKVQNSNNKTSLSLELFDKADNINEDIYDDLLSMISTLAWDESIKLFFLNAKTSSIAAEIGSIKGLLGSVMVELYVILIKEKEKGWLDTGSDEVKDELKEAYSKNMKIIESVELGLKELNKKL